MEGKNSHQSKEDQPGKQPQLHCRSEYSKRRLITSEIGARKTEQARLSGTVHGTVNPEHHRRGCSGTSKPVFVEENAFCRYSDHQGSCG